MIPSSDRLFSVSCEKLMSKAKRFLTEVNHKRNEALYKELQDVLDKLGAKYGVDYITDPSVDAENIMDRVKEEGIERDSEKWFDVAISAALSAASMRLEDGVKGEEKRRKSQQELGDIDTYYSKGEYGKMRSKNIADEKKWSEE